MKTLDKLLLGVGKIVSKPIYRLYEKWLWIQIKNGPFPTHIGIIPDGNRRWARKQGLEPGIGHIYGYEKMKEVLRWIWELGIKYVTIYAMSSENCKYRTPEERENLFNIARKGLNELLEMKDIHEKKVHVRVFGNYNLIPKDIIKLAKKVEEKTRNYSNFYLNIAICYGGRQEIINAVKKIVEDAVNGLLKPSMINEEIFAKYLYTNNCPDPDLIIRTSGEERISNFLLWQSAYSELYFCEAYWPEFRKIDFWRAIRSYQMRERRFGR
ncbi:MAG: di-trans,poly-cis-decaprenylcistransferase [Desulfurococcales archaeon ex4484_58]|nr:MAG: di-trans,poly-cis-decaprenylcistransferase [Desulfurococcales archaeon ex4484_58]